MNFGALFSSFTTLFLATLQTLPDETPQNQGTGPAPAIQAGNAVMECELSDLFVSPGATTMLDVYVRNVSPTLVRGFQTDIFISGSMGNASATVPCPCPCPPAMHSDGGVKIIESRNDFIFFGQSSIVSAVNCSTWRALCSKLSGGVEVGSDRVFLSEYLIAVSPDAVPGSQFEITLLPPNDSLLVDSANNQITFAIGPPSILTVAALPDPLVVTIQLVAVSSPSPSEVVSALPNSFQSIRQNSSYFVEVWTQINDPHGLQSVSINLNFSPSMTHAFGITPATVFSQFTSGIIENNLGRVRDLSGSHELASPPCSHQVAFAPNWARLATAQMSADSLGGQSITPGPATSPFLGTAVCGQLGDVDPEDIDFVGVQFSVTPDVPVPAVSDWGILVMGLLMLTAGTIRVFVQNSTHPKPIKRMKNE